MLNHSLLGGLPTNKKKKRRKVPHTRKIFTTKSYQFNSELSTIPSGTCISVHIHLVYNSTVVLKVQLGYGAGSVSEENDMHKMDGRWIILASGFCALLCVVCLPIQHDWMPETGRTKIRPTQLNHIISRSLVLYAVLTKLRHHLLICSRLGDDWCPWDLVSSQARGCLCPCTSLQSYRWGKGHQFGPSRSVCLFHYQAVLSKFSWCFLCPCAMASDIQSIGSVRHT